MPNPSITGVIFILLAAFVNAGYDTTFGDLEALGVPCPGNRFQNLTALQTRYMCHNQRHNIAYRDRGCECDDACHDFNDCCINALPRTTERIALRDRMTCLRIGEKSNEGVYAIATCPNGWIGESQVRQRCEGPINFSDPLNAAPVTSVESRVTYRNRFCAECNDANMANLKTFNLLLSCDGLSPTLTQEQIYADLRYNEQLDVWGVDRMNNSGDSVFFICDIFFDAPSSFHNRIRLCTSNLISNCPPRFPRNATKRNCYKYMAAVYDDNYGYRNPHCAICNGRTVADVSCNTEIDGRKRPMSFALLLDINQSDGDQVGRRQVTTPECQSNHKYDPFFKKCRRLVCAIPGRVIVNGKCVTPPE